MKFIAKTDKEDGCLVYYKVKPLMKDLRMILGDVTRERKKEQDLTEALVNVASGGQDSG